MKNANKKKGKLISPMMSKRLSLQNKEIKFKYFNLTDDDKDNK